LKQGDALSSLLFNFALEYGIRKDYLLLIYSGIPNSTVENRRSV